MTTFGTSRKRFWVSREVTAMKVIELRAWYLDWTTKPADTHREINQALSKESFDKISR